MHTLRFKTSIILVASLLGLLFNACAKNRPEQERIGQSSIVDKRDYPDVPAVILLDRSEVTFSYSTKNNVPYAQKLVTKRAQIFDERGLDIAKETLSYDERSEILWVRGRLLKSSGEVIEIDDNMSVRTPRFAETSPLGELYNAGNGILRTKVLGAEVGDVVELNYLRVYKDPRWIEPIEIGGRYPVVRGEVVIDAPRSFDIDTRVSKVGRQVNIRPTKLPVMVKGSSGAGEGVSGTRLSYVFENEPAIYPEEGQPPLSSLTTQIHVQLRSLSVGSKKIQGYRTWDDVAAWYLDLVKGSDQPSAYLREVLKPYGGIGGSKTKKLQRAQRFVQDQIADAPPGEHLAQFRTRASKSIVEKGVGDAKDQVSLTLAILRTMGLDGFPLLVSRVGSFAPITDLPTPAPFNHVIVAVPAGGRYRFIDPSVPSLAEGRLPGFLQGQQALLVRESGGELIDLAIEDKEANRRSLKYDLQMNKEGFVGGSLTLTLRGLDAAFARTLYRENKSLQKIAALLENRFAPKKEGDQGQSLSWRKVLPIKPSQRNPNKPLTLRVVLDKAPVASETLSLEVDRLLGRPLAQLWREGRRSPWVNPFAYTTAIRLSLKLPRAYGVEGSRDDVEIENEWFSASDKYFVANGKLIIESAFSLQTRRLSPEAYADFHQALKSFWSRRDRPIKIIRGGERGEDYRETPF